MGRGSGVRVGALAGERFGLAGSWTASQVPQVLASFPRRSQRITANWEVQRHGVCVYRDR
jgi:hypothetical protein